jgi:predicted dienelactone hydrolase
MRAMKYIIAALLFLSLPANAQENPPEARAFEKGITSFQQYEQQKLGGAAKPDAKTPDMRAPNVEIWLPPQFQTSEEKWPLIVFSHGFGGCAKQSTFLTSYLADQGYIVIAPDHADADCRGRISQGMRSGKAAWPERPFRQPESWTDKTEADRKDDILFAVESLLDDRMYKNYVDTQRMGLIGHSLGGYTALGLAGAWPSWKDKRFKAVLALSPFAAPFIVNKGLRKIHFPVMYQGGTKDTGITPALKKNGGGGYALTPAPKYFLEFQGAGHFAWTELERGHQAIIQESALAFFDKYLKEKPVEIAYETKGQVKTFWKDEGEKAVKPSSPGSSPDRAPVQ